MPRVDTQLRSNEVQQIMNRVPPAILRWGSAVIALAVALLIGIASFITIPVTERCRVAIANNGGAHHAEILLTPAALSAVLGGATSAAVASPFLGPDPVAATITSVRTDTLIGGAYPAALNLPAGFSLPAQPQLIEATAEITVSRKTLFAHLRNIVAGGR